MLALPSPLPRPLQEVLCTYLFLAPKDWTVPLRPDWPFLALGPTLDLPQRRNDPHGRKTVHPLPSLSWFPKLFLVPHATGKPFAQWTVHFSLLLVGMGSIKPLVQSSFACLKSSGLC